MLSYWRQEHHSILHPAHPSSRQHLSNDDCLEEKREDYHNCSVLYCVWQSCTVIRTRTSSS